MGRATNGSASNRKKRRVMRAAAGFHGARGRTFRLAKEALRRARVYAFRDRRARKRDFRALWVTRLTAACRMRGIAYSRFIYGLLAADIELNRKMLSEMAIHSPTDFDALVELAKEYQPNAAAA